VKSLCRFALSVSGAAAAAILLLAHLPTALAQPAAETGLAATGNPALDTRVRYQTVAIDGIDVFYREAGPAGAPVLLLLHGFPASSFMYRDLIARLSDRFRVIAPDYPGFGSAMRPRRTTLPTPSTILPTSSKNSLAAWASRSTRSTCRISAAPSASV
jgi:hypothetical protein